MEAEKSQLKVKKKTWYQVYTSPIFGEMLIGELPLAEPSLMSGRPIQANLMNLTGNPKNQNVNIGFRIEKIVGAKGIAFPISYTIIPSTIRRLVKRKTDRIDDSFTATSADGVKIKIKPMFVTRSQTKNSVVTHVRKEARKFLTNAISGSNYATFFLDVINYRVQKMLREHIKKIYPLAICEIRAMETAKGQSLVNISEEPKRAEELAEKKMPEPRPQESLAQGETEVQKSAKPAKEDSEDSENQTEIVQAEQ